MGRPRGQTGGEGCLAGGNECPIGGMRNLRASAEFLKSGGTELAPMSTSEDLRIALKYTRGADAGALVFMLKAQSFMQLGADLTYLSAFPEEREFLYPPLVYLRPTGETHRFTYDGVEYTVIEIDPQYPS